MFLRVLILISSLYLLLGCKQNYYNPEFEDNLLIKMVVGQGLVQYGYFYSKDVEDFILINTNDLRPYVRSKAVEILASIGTVSSVEMLTKVFFNDIDMISIRAFDSLLSIARGQKRILPDSGVLLAQEKVMDTYKECDSLSPQVSDYIKNIHKNGFKFKKFVESNNKEGIHVYPSTKVFPLSIRLLQPYVEAGDPYALYMVGIKYLDGDEVDADMEKGLSYLIASAKGGYVDAYYELAQRYGTGEGVPIDKEKELHYRRLLGNSLRK
jgi:hypothetical protein